MKAYAILDGGGVKGAALVGCLKAAQDRGVDFVGYGGTSAGSIVAVLAAVGFKPDELRSILVDKTNFTDFLDDGGSELAKLLKLPGNLRKTRSVAWYYLRNSASLNRISKELGLYKAQKLQDFLLERIREKQPHLRRADVTFEELHQSHCAPLKIVASDLRSHEPVIFSGSGHEDLNGSVLDAVRASISYPFVFRPVEFNRRFFVDGGLSSNLPIFLFEHERRQNGLPVIAFDLIAPKASGHEKERFEQFCSSLFTTALESTDVLLRKVLSGVYHVPVDVPSDIGTLDFSLSKDKRQELFDVGYRATTEFFGREFKHWEQATTQVQRLQALHVPPAFIVPVLKSIAKAFETKAGARNVRANIMLPTDHGTRIVVYQYGMNMDPDSDLELNIDAGCSGGAWSKKQPVFANLLDAKRLFESWGMTQEQQAKIRKDRKAMMSFPIFDLGGALTARGDVSNLDLIGVLSIDTSTQLKETGWILHQDAIKESVIREGANWADVLSRILR